MDIRRIIQISNYALTDSWLRVKKLNHEEFWRKIYSSYNQKKIDLYLTRLLVVQQWNCLRKVAELV
jgi:hypothetical protein